MDLIIFCLLFPLMAWDAINDVNYTWWRKWLGEEPERS